MLRELRTKFDENYFTRSNPTMDDAIAAVDRPGQRRLPPPDPLPPDHIWIPQLYGQLGSVVKVAAASGLPRRRVRQILVAQGVLPDPDPQRAAEVAS